MKKLLILFRIIAWCAFLYVAGWFAVRAYEARYLSEVPALPYAQQVQRF